MREDVDQAHLVVEVDHQAQRLAVAAGARQVVAGQREEAAVAGEDQQLVGGLGGDQELELVALLELEFRGVFHAALGGADPAALAEDDGDRLAHDHGFERGLGVDLRRVGERGAADVEVGQLGLGVLEPLPHQLPLGLVGRQHADDAVALFAELGVLAADLHLLQPGQLAQAGVEDGVGLQLGEREGLDQLGLGMLLVADDADHLVQIEVGDHQAVEDVQPGFDLGQAVAGSTDQHLAAVVEEGDQGLLEVHHPGRAAGIQDVEVHAEAGLEVGELEQALHQDVGLDVAALGLEHQTDVFRGLVAHVAQQRGLLVVDQLGQLLDQIGLLHLIRDLGDDDLVHPLAQILLGPGGADADAATAGLVDAEQAGPRLDDDAAGGEVRALDVGHQGFDAAVGIVQQHEAGVDQLAGVVRRDRGGHADGDAGGAVGEQVGEAGGQDDGLVVGAVVGGLEVDRVLFDAVEQQRGGHRQLSLGVAHGRGVIAVDVAEVALPVDLRIALGEVLGHADQGVVDRLVAVRVIAAHHLADHLGALARGVLGVQPHLAHGVQHAALNRLQAVADVGQRAVGDDRKGVGEIAARQGFRQRLVDDAVAVARTWRGGVNTHGPSLARAGIRVAGQSVAIHRAAPG